MPTIPTLAFPPRLDADGFVTVEQDSQADIDGSVEVVARCPRGHLDSMPDMGLPDWTLTRGTPDAADVRRGIEPYEPRVDLLIDARLIAMAATITIDREA